MFLLWSTLNCAVCSSCRYTCTLPIAALPHRTAELCCCWSWSVSPLAPCAVLSSSMARFLCYRKPPVSLQTGYIQHRICTTFLLMQWKTAWYCCDCLFPFCSLLLTGYNPSLTSLWPRHHVHHHRATCSQMDFRFSAGMMIPSCCQHSLTCMGKRR